MDELQPGLWHWQAPHPDWEPGEAWPQEVSSYAIDDGTRLLFFDPLAVPDELLSLAAEREPVVVLTSPWHERDAERLAAQLGAPVYAPPADSAQDLIDKFGITAEQAGDGSPDLRWLRQGGGEAHWYGADDRLPFGVQAFAGRDRNDLVLWVDGAGAVIAGDTLADFGNGLGLNEWLRGDSKRDQIVAGLRPLLDLPVERVLPTHGGPADRAALERALS
ncbi:MAG TPA: MBL fold metallo-hydrolase [Gaiellaceae bacterium]|nr:MBL fold metallo-hydrolase [Gaiellaceae bacterium]